MEIKYLERPTWFDKNNKTIREKIDEINEKLKKEGKITWEEAEFLSVWDVPSRESFEKFGEIFKKMMQEHPNFSLIDKLLKQ